MITRNLKSQLWALFTDGGGVKHFDIVDGVHTEHNEGEYVVHQAEDDSIWVLLFEDLRHAERVAKEYHEATGGTCEPRTTLVAGLDYDQHVRLYRMDGTWQDYTRPDYMEALLFQSKPSYWERKFNKEEEN
jgi:hypothetical protein